MIRDLNAVLPLVASDDHLRHPQSSDNSAGDVADNSGAAPGTTMKGNSGDS